MMGRVYRGCRKTWQCRNIVPALPCFAVVKINVGQETISCPTPLARLGHTPQKHSITVVVPPIPFSLPPCDGYQPLHRYNSPNLPIPIPTPRIPPIHQRTDYHLPPPRTAWA